MQMYDDTHIDAAAARVARRSIPIDAARSAILAAGLAMIHDHRNDSAGRDHQIRALWDAIGYHAQPRGSAEYRGDCLPPRMFRLPSGGRVPWHRRWHAVRAWVGII